MENTEKNKEIIEDYICGNDLLIKKLNSEWFNVKDDSIYQNMLKNVSIGFFNPMYIEINDIQNISYEYNKIQKFLKKYLNRYSNINNIALKDLNLEFINYGTTELVYVLTEKNGKRITLLVKQPAVKYGKVKQEADNLLELSKFHSNIIAPIDFYEYGDQELYATSYINQARCIASNGSWGMYVPEPYYRFEPFTRVQEEVVTTCMIAKLISMYDFDNNQGISACKLGGGDFMLPKGWEKESPNIENTLSKLYLIAAREKVRCSFEKYIDIIKNEFSRRTIEDNQDELIINHRGRVPIKMNYIENGIMLGKTIIENDSTLFEKVIVKK